MRGVPFAIAGTRAPRWWACVLALTVFACVVLTSPTLASAQAQQVRITELQCNRDPEVVAITNQGTAVQDLEGWTLRSDPVESEVFDLSTIGSLSPGASVLVQSGPQAGGLFVWSNTQILRDDDAQDFARVVDASGAVVHEVNCGGGTSAPTAAPTAAPAATPDAADGVPVGGGPPSYGSESSAGAMMFAGGLLTALGLASIIILWQRRPAAQAVSVTTQPTVSGDPSQSWRYRHDSSGWLLFVLSVALVAFAARTLLFPRRRR
jgi:hypothetical protein